MPPSVVPDLSVTKIDVLILQVPMKVALTAQPNLNEVMMIMMIRDQEAIH